jgi:formylglycine-generating enzyme required for sulfatase activity
MSAKRLTVIAALLATACRLAAGGPVDTNAAAGGAPELGRPWRNSLGMEFIPIPGTSLSFSKWETRVQDYSAFVQRTGRKWPKPKIEQEPTHPAVNVTWDDAQAFCAWLTEREQKVGFLPAGCQYRLPKDLEWSAAAGLGPETGKTPFKRNGETKGVYPWDGPFPPPTGAGNYASVRETDKYEYTAPVGSFSTNRYGICDLGGNVSEWCLDGWLHESFAPGPGDRTLRGGSWFHSAPWHLASSARDKAANNFDDIRIGFRVVLELSIGEVEKHTEH